MRVILFLLLLWLFPTSALAGWVEGSIIGVRDDHANAATFARVGTYFLPDGPAPFLWHTVDVTTLGIPRDALAVLVSGQLLITHGTTPALCYLGVTFRLPGDTWSTNQLQFFTNAPSVPDGPRTNGAALIPVRAGVFEWQWTRSTEGEWPEHCSYGVNLKVQLYVR